MAFRVEILPSALADAEEAYRWWRENAPGNADAWLNGLLDAILTLQEFPLRCAVAPEGEDLGLEIRQLLYGKRRTSTYRILFRVGGDLVRVLRVRHAARDRLTRPDLAEPDP